MTWTPVSQGLPVKAADYLVSVENDRVSWTAQDYFNGNRWRTYKDSKTGWPHGWPRITAWQPLPEPYREGE